MADLGRIAVTGNIVVSGPEYPSDRHDRKLDQILDKLDQALALLARTPGGGDGPSEPGDEDNNPPEPPDYEEPDDGGDNPDGPGGGGPSGLLHPSQVLPVLRWWTIMLPTGSQGDPDNEYLVDRSIPDTYYVNGAGEVVFECPADGVHSPNSKYARCEARQMVPGREWAKSAWPAGEHHRLVAELAIDLWTLDNRPRINGLQIHDGGDDVMQIQAREDGTLGISHNDGDSWELLDPAYPRGGAFFRCVIDVDRNTIRVDYQRGEIRRTVTIPKSGSGWYWKAGCYVNTGGASQYRNSPGARGRVLIRSLTVDPA